MQSKQCVLRPNILAYHVNDKVRCETFISNGNYLIISKDTTWLGLGMYFWDNQSNALYWLKEKQRKDRDNEIYICAKCNLILQEEIVLDITDKKTANKIDELWSKYIKISKEYINEKRIGVKLDILFRILPNFKEYGVIKAHAIYPKDRYIDFFKSEYGRCHISSNVKTIYLVKKSELAINRELWRLNHEE